MATAEEINGVIDLIIDKMRDNISSLGGSAESMIIEGDEEPTYLERYPGFTGFPIFFVVPLGAGGDSMKQSMSTPDLIHTFKVTIIGFYKDYTVEGSLRSTRNYGYNLIDLFTSPHNHLTGDSCAAYIIDPVLQCGYWRVSDYIIHDWIATLTIKTKTGGSH